MLKCEVKWEGCFLRKQRRTVHEFVIIVSFSSFVFVKRNVRERERKRERERERERERGERGAIEETARQ